MQKYSFFIVKRLFYRFLTSLYLFYTFYAFYFGYQFVELEPVVDK